MDPSHASAAGKADPHATLRGTGERGNRRAGSASLPAPRPRLEACAVESDETVWRTEPEIAVEVLSDREHVAGLFVGPRGKRVTDRPVRRRRRRWRQPVRAQARERQRAARGSVERWLRGIHVNSGKAARPRGRRPGRALILLRHRSQPFIRELLDALSVVGLGRIDVALRIGGDVVHAMPLTGWRPPSPNAVRISSVSRRRM